MFSTVAAIQLAPDTLYAGQHLHEFALYRILLQRSSFKVEAGHESCKLKKYEQIMLET